MLVIRLFRTGKKNQPSFKIVVTDKKNPPRGGRFVEQVGFYNPLTKEKSLKKERIKYWVGQGAKPSDTVHNLLVKEGILEGKKIPVHKKTKKKEEKAEETPIVQPEAKTTEAKPRPPEPNKAEETAEAKPQSPEPLKEEVKEVSPQSNKTEESEEEEKK